MTPKRAGAIFIVVLNWNGWRDTVRCLESLFRLKLESHEVRIVVCDNASSDSSLDKTAAWANGELLAPENGLPSDSIKQALYKPIEFRRYSRFEAERSPLVDVPLILIENGANLGFAGGCNVGVRFALRHPTCSYVWLLNNDTVVEATALSEMLAVCQANPKVGICGSQVRFFATRDRIQSFGGRLNPWFCTTHHLFCGTNAETVRGPPQQIDYVPGVSMLVARSFLEQVGLMAEEYFLYFEEIDWAERGKSSHDLAVSLKSIVYHIGSASIGSPSEESERGVRSEYFLLRGRLLFARKFYARRLAVVYLGLIVSVLKRLLRGNWLRAWVALCAVTGVRPKMLRLPTEALAQGK